MRRFIESTCTYKYGLTEFTEDEKELFLSEDVRHIRQTLTTKTVNNDPKLIYVLTFKTVNDKTFQVHFYSYEEKEELLNEFRNAV